MELLELETIKFSSLKSGLTKHGRPFTFRQLKLPWEGDCTNVIVPIKDMILIGTEMGKILLFDLSKNRCKAIITSDEQVSGITYSNNFIWSVGRHRKVVCQQSHTGSIVMVLQEMAEIINYSDMGITFNTSFNKQYLIYNCGQLKFKILHVKTKKIVKKINIETFLKGKSTFSNFTSNEKIVWRYCVGRTEPKLFIVLNRYHPHLIIFDYLKLQVEIFMSIFVRTDWISGPVVPVISLNIAVSDLDDYVFFVNQIRDQKTKAVDSYFRVMQRSEDRSGYVVQGTREFPSSQF